MDNKKDNKRLIAIIVGIIVLIVVATIGYNFLSEKYGKGQEIMVSDNQQEEQPEKSPQSQEDTTEEPAKEKKTRLEAPNITVFNDAGEEVQLKDLVGKPMVLNFWASWCGPCRMEMPEFQQVYEERGEEVEFVMINLTDGDRETVEGAKAYLEKEGLSLPVYYDLNQEGAINYRVMAVPTTYFVNAEGDMVGYIQSAIDKDTLIEGIELAINEVGETLEDTPKE